MFCVLNFHSDRMRTKRTKFGPHEYFPLYSNSSIVVLLIYAMTFDLEANAGIG